MLLNKVNATVKKYGMLSSGDRVVVAVSGGPDSICLLTVLIELSKELGLSLYIAHLDHMFRGKESADEASFVADTAKKLGIPARIEQIDVAAFCRQRGLSAQSGAREIRYGFLEQVAAEINAARIATGHTATDQAETFLLRLLRGAGVAGLSGIPPVREKFIRPLIEITREEVIAYLSSLGIDYVSDSSNAKPVYSRNRIRMNLVPLLRQFNPQIIHALASEAAILRDEDEAVETCLAILAAGAIEPRGDTVVIKRPDFIRLPLALRRRLLRKAIEAAGIDSSRFSRIQIDEALLFMADARTGRVLQLPCGIEVEREYETFLIPLSETQQDFSQVLRVPGITELPALGLEVESQVQQNDGPAEAPEELDAHDRANYSWKALFDYDKIGPLSLRNRLPGDWFCPSGMGGKTKKLQDYFVDEKVPRRKRGTVPLLVSGSEILWVVGYRTDERYGPSHSTKRKLVVTVRESKKAL